MASDKNSGYRKNFSLIVTFLILISALFILSLFLAYNFSKKFIENEFVSEKVKVLEASIKPYNDFFQNKLPEVSYYNGYLDSATTAKFVDTLLLQYPFVSRVIFYDAEVSSRPVRDGLNTGHFSIGPKYIYQFGSLVPLDSVKLFSRDEPQRFGRGMISTPLELSLSPTSKPSIPPGRPVPRSSSATLASCAPIKLLT